MRLWLDFGDGNGAVDYTAAVVAASSANDKSNVQTSVEAFVIERQRGAYARCYGTLHAAPFGLQLPQQGGRVVVRADGGAMLFSGVIVAPPQQANALGNADCPLLFEAVEDAFLANIAPNTSLQPVSAATHAVRFSDHAITLEPSSASVAGERADDLLVTGAEEPVTYVTELFRGDGTTANFTLTAQPFRTGGSGTLLRDSFAGTRLQNAVWWFSDPGQHIKLGTGGLRLTGGNGLDGQTYMAGQQPVEMGGTLYAEMRGVLLLPGSDGVLLGMYGNVVTVPTCFAGIRVKAAAGAQTLVALVRGAEVGTPLQWSTGHSYTLRVRLHCTEMQRVLGTYQALVNGAVETWGAGLVDAPMQMVIEVLDEGLASSTPATVLYTGAMSSSVARAVFAPVNSVSLVGSVAQVSLQQQGPVWVTTTETDGTVTARRPGTLDTGEDYRISGTSLEFFSGRVPSAGALVAVRYRLSQRAEARLQNADAVTRMQELGLPGLRVASRRVTDPEPRSAADCAAAAQALLRFYADPAFGVRGTCVMPLADATGDVQPGDAIALPLAATPVTVPVKRVTMEPGHSVPEVVTHHVRFALDQDNGLSFRSEAGAAADALLPAEMYVVSTTASLPGLAVTVAGKSSLQVDAGVVPPVGGGFEVRRHDGGWGPDQAGAPPDDELVLRSPVRSFSVPRAGFAERFYVRMYDGSETPVYSAQSCLLSTRLPVE